MTRTLTLTPLLLALAACGVSETNPPTESAPPPAAAPASAAPAGGLRPGTGAASFVGRWSADAAWCAAPMGDRRPIQITATQFEGYENSCLIADVAEDQGGWNATLHCLSEGQERRERVRMAVTGDVLSLTYVDREGGSATLRRCPATE